MQDAIEESKKQYNLMIIGISRLADDAAFLETSHLITLTGVSHYMMSWVLP